MAKDKELDDILGSDAGVDLDFSDLSDISLEELDALDDIDLDLDLDDIDFDDLDVTDLKPKKREKKTERKKKEKLSKTLDDIDDVFSAADKAREDDLSYPDVLEEDNLEEIGEVDNLDDEPVVSNNDDIDSLLGMVEETSAIDDQELDFENILDPEPGINDSAVAESIPDISDVSSEDNVTSENVEDMDLDDIFSALGIEPDESEGVDGDLSNGSVDLDDLLNEALGNTEGIEGLEEIEEIEELSSKTKKKKKPKKPAQTLETEETTKKKKGMKEILFGEPDEDDLEEEEYFKELKEKKAVKKEEKAAKKAEKKEENTAKKAEKDAASQAKKAQLKADKDEKKRLAEEEYKAELAASKPVSTPVVIIVFVLFAALCGAVVFGTQAINYKKVIKKATDYFNRQRYHLAYDEISGVEVKEKDQELKDKIYTVMYVERLYESYENNMKLERYDKALDSLLRGIEKYDEHYDEAVELDIVKDIDSSKQKIIAALATTYALSLDDAYSILELEGQEYNRKLLECCEHIKIPEPEPENKPVDQDVPTTEAILPEMQPLEETSEE